MWLLLAMVEFNRLIRYIVNNGNYRIESLKRIRNKIPRELVHSFICYSYSLRMHFDDTDVASILINSIIFFRIFTSENRRQQSSEIPCWWLDTPRAWGRYPSSRERGWPRYYPDYKCPSTRDSVWRDCCLCAASAREASLPTDRPERVQVILRGKTNETYLLPREERTGRFNGCRLSRSAIVAIVVRLLGSDRNRSVTYQPRQIRSQRYRMTIFSRLR